MGWGLKKGRVIAFTLHTSQLSFYLEVRKNACRYRIQVMIVRMKVTGEGSGAGQLKDLGSWVGLLEQLYES